MSFATVEMIQVFCDFCEERFEDAGYVRIFETESEAKDEIGEDWCWSVAEDGRVACEDCHHHLFPDEDDES